jgi:hypothetical protein
MLYGKNGELVVLKKLVHIITIVFQRINIVMDAYEHVKEPADKTKS